MRNGMLKNGKRLLSLATAFILLIGSFTWLSTVGAAVDTTKFSAYYTADAKTTAPTEVALTKYWAEDSASGLMKRNDKDINWNGFSLANLGILYYNVSKYKYFEMTVDYRTYDSAGGNNGSCLFGFGVQDMNQSFYNNSNAYCYNINSHGGLQALNSNWLTAAVAGSSSSWNGNGTHTLKIRVTAKKMAVSIDDVTLAAQNIGNYHEAGYIFFASHEMTTQFGVPVVTELPDTDIFSMYYTENAKTNEAMTAESLAAHWEVPDNMIKRNDQHCNWDNGYGNLSVAYLNTKKYKDFELTVDYQVVKAQNDYANHGCIIGFGATEMGKSFYYDKNTYTSNIISYGGILNADSTTWRNTTALIDKVSDWDRYAVHTLTLRVVDNIVTYTIDDNFVYGEVLKSYSEAGYIFFASNEQDTKFGLPTVRELSPSEPTGDRSSPLYGKSAIFVGDSISYGALDDVKGLAWAGRIGQKYGMTWVNNSISGTTVSGGAYHMNGSTQTPIAPMKEQLADGNFDYVVIEGGINDALHFRDHQTNPLGEISESTEPADFDTQTFGGALEELFYTAKQKYPQAKIGYIVTFQVPAIADAAVSPYYNLAKQICEKWDIEYIDLYHDSEVTGWFVDKQSTYLPDKLHPNADGYALVTPKIEKWMNCLAVGHSDGGAWKSDGDGHWHECLNCGTVIDKAAHTYDNACDTTCNVCDAVRTVTHSYQTTWSENDTNHWHECSLCGTKADETAHTWEWIIDKAATEEETGLKHEECTVCKKTRNGNTVIDKQEHIHAMIKTEAKAATCTEHGNISYWQCSKCKKYYNDKTGTVEITLAETVVPAKGHADLIKTERKEATSTQTGNIEFYTCPDCNTKFKDAQGKESITDTVIPMAAVDAVKLESANKEVTVSGAANAVPSGVVLKAEPQKSDSVVIADSGKDKYNLATAAVFNIYLEKDGKEIRPNGRIKVSIAVPKGLDGTKCRVLHIDANGKLTDMNAAYENGCMVFETDHFSLYAIVETKAAGSTGNTGNTDTVAPDKIKNEKTGVNSIVGLGFVMFTLAGSAVCILVASRKKRAKK